MFRRQFLSWSAVAAASALTVPMHSWAQLSVNVTGFDRTQIPMLVVDFRGEQLLDMSLGNIIRADLKRSGMFQMMALDITMDEKTPIVNSEWRELAIDALLSGSVRKMDNGQFEVYFRLWDIATNQELINEGYTVSAADLRLAAHHIADVVFQKMTGYPGAFASQIAYVSNEGSKHTLYVADSDGERAKAIYSSTQPIISPAWSPDGSKLAYVSFELEKPVIYSHVLATGQRSVLANYKGSNSAPAWSPNGMMAAALTLSGLSQIYALDGQGKSPQRLTRTAGIDTQPRFSGDGQFIYFVSDRGGNPQVYRMPAAGGNAQRVTFNSNYSVDPAVSPDGKWLAYVGQAQGRFGLQLQNLSTGAAHSLTDTSADATPSFAPNSLLIMYSTQIGGKNTLMTTTLDGEVRMPLAVGNAKEVAWGPRLL